MAKPGAQQPVVQVAAIGIEGRMAGAEAPHDHRRHIGQRQSQNQQGEQQTHGGESLGWPHDAHGSQGKPQEVGAPIPHENPGGVEVVA